MEELVLGVDLIVHERSCIFKFWENLDFWNSPKKSYPKFLKALLVFYGYSLAATTPSENGLFK